MFSSFIKKFSIESKKIDLLLQFSMNVYPFQFNIPSSASTFFSLVMIQAGHRHSFVLNDNITDRVNSNCRKALFYVKISGQIAVNARYLSSWTQWIIIFDNTWNVFPYANYITIDVAIKDTKYPYCLIFILRGHHSLSTSLLISFHC